MSKLIQAYIANPSDKTLEKIRRYIAIHPMSVCFATQEEAQVLAIVACQPSHS